MGRDIVKYFAFVVLVAYVINFDSPIRPFQLVYAAAVEGLGIPSGQFFSSPFSRFAHIFRTLSLDIFFETSHPKFGIKIFREQREKT